VTETSTLSRVKTVEPFSPGSATWLGHATVVVVTPGGTRIIFDPWLENPKFPAHLPALDTIDAIAVTHGHFDHIGSVVPLAASTGARVICVPELAAYFASVGVANLTEMNKGGSIAVHEVTLTMVGADHSCGVSPAGGGPSIYGGNPVGFVLRLPFGQPGPVYVSGDTNVFSDMALIKELYAPEIAFVPIDGHYNMGPKEAALAVKLLGVARVVPIHHGTFEVLTGTPRELRGNIITHRLAVKTVTIEPGQAVPLAP
jgi:L-ascorbate metabolism protein UlaG (beta-lactamase superfamily)